MISRYPRNFPCALYFFSSASQTVWPLDDGSSDIWKQRLLSVSYGGDLHAWRKFWNRSLRNGAIYVLYRLFRLALKFLFQAKDE